MYLFYVSKQNLMHFTMKLKQTKGHDEIPAFTFRDYAYDFAEPLTIFNLLLGAAFPNIWKNMEFAKLSNQILKVLSKFTSLLQLVVILPVV